ncbi:unnamed protein product [Macrosiphum euphorbiae]|nr:unnamed protein product [Macrosiphum euphorbiae]
MLSKFDPVIQKHVKRIKDKETHVHYLGHRIQDELIEIMANEVRKSIINLIKKHRYYSVIIDCTPDISHQEQVSLVFRIVNMHWDKLTEPSIQELFMDFVNIHSTSGLSLSNLLISKLAEYEIPLSDCRGQGYDNGSNMVGEYQGVQSRIRAQNQRAFFAPCAAHKLNLLLCDVSQSCIRAISFFGMIERVYTLFSASTKRWDILKKHCSIVLKKWTATRWESRYKCVKAIRDQLPEVLNALEEIAECSNDPKSVSEAKSIIDELMSFEFVLSLVIWHDILGQVKIVNRILQDPKMDLDASASSLGSLITFLEKYRTNGFENAKLVGIEIVESIGGTANFKEKRPRKKKKMFNYESNDEYTISSEEEFRRDYFLILIDRATEALRVRFEYQSTFNSNFGFLYRIGKLKHQNDDFIKNCCNDLQNVLSEGNSRDINGADLYMELLIFRSIVDENATPLQALSFLKNVSSSFPNIEVAIRIMLTIPVTSAGAERSFSKLKLIKNYLRSNLSQHKLSDLALISIEHSIADSLSYNETIDQFASKKIRKKIFK